VETRYARDGRLKAKPSRIFDFEEIREAHRVMEANEAKGKMVVVHAVRAASDCMETAALVAMRNAGSSSDVYFKRVRALISLSLATHAWARQWAPIPGQAAWMYETFKAWSDSGGTSSVCYRWMRCLVDRAKLSQIDDDVADRLRAANKKVAVSGLLEWLRSVDDRP
jgi:hypothetical protein